MTYHKHEMKGESISKDVFGYLEKLLIDIDEDDQKSLPKWRIKCIDVLNQKIKDVLLCYHAKRLGSDKRYSDYQKGQN